MTDLNHVTLIGRTTKDAELKSTQSGASVASASLAVNRSYMVNGDKREEVSFLNLVIWGKSAEAFAKYVRKGHRVAIEGRLQQRTWQDKDGNNRQAVEVVVESFQFLEPKHEGQAAQNNGYLHPSTGQSSGVLYPDSYDNAPLPDKPPDSFDDTDIPF